jgi:multidrug resistance efflux pump
MIELVVGTYGFACWLLFKKLRLVPINTYTVMTALLGGVVLILTLLTAMMFCHPSSADGRLYAPVVQITSQVRGMVTEVPVTPNEPLKAGDVLFRIDPRPFQFEVDALNAKLAQANVKVAQLSSKLAAAEAATRFAKSNLLISESETDRQARIALEKSVDLINQTKARLAFAKSNLERYTELQKRNTVATAEFEQAKRQEESLTAELGQAEAAKRAAEETLRSGSDRMQAAREDVKQAEAQEQETRTALNAEIGGVNPEVRQVMAELDQKRWELEQTVVRAPSEGMATQVFLRPGQMAVPIPLTAPMVFVPNERPTLVATFSQNVVAGIEPGLEAEVAFRAYPGRIFKAKVVRVLPIVPEGQAVASGQLRAATVESAPGTIPVLFEYGDDVAALNLPVGAQATVAVYTHHIHALGFLRKIILRIKSWENYVPFLGAVLGH